MRTVSIRRLFKREKTLGHVDEPMLSVYRDRGVVLKDEALNPNKTAEDRGIYQLVEPGWLVVNRMKAWQGSLGISEHRGIVSGHYICFRPHHHEVDRYLHYLLRSGAFTAYFASISRGVRPGQVEIDNDQLGSTALTLPEASEQRRISDFLDDQAARIDNIIAARSQEIRSLRQAYVAALQGIADRESASFGTMRLRHAMAGIEQGWSPQADSRPAELGEWGVMRSGCVNGGTFRADDNKALPVDVTPRVEYRIRPNDVLLSRASGSVELIGSVAVVPENIPENLLLCDKIYRLELLAEWAPRFIAPMLRTHANRERIRLGVSGAEGMANNLPSGVVRDLVIPRTPSAQQQRVADEIEREQVRLDDFAAWCGRSVDLLIEYKQSLITAAVTDELDVTTARTGIPA